MKARLFRLICRAINRIFLDGQAAKIGQWKMHYICFIYRAVRSIYFAYIEKPGRFVRACRSTKRRPFARLRVQHGVMNFSTTRVAFSTRRVDNVRSNVSILPSFIFRSSTSLNMHRVYDSSLHHPPPPPPPLFFFFISDSSASLHSLPKRERD